MKLYYAWITDSESVIRETEVADVDVEEFLDSMEFYKTYEECKKNAEEFLKTHKKYKKLLPGAIPVNF